VPDHRAGGYEIVPEKTGERKGADRLTQIAADAQRRLQELTMADGRRIILPGLFNLRDLGGYPTHAGTVPWRMLFRSDSLHRLDAAGIACLDSLEVRTVIDLRTHVEAEIAPSPLDQLTARVSHISVLGGDLQALPLELDAIYRHVVDQGGSAIADAIRLLCAEQAFPALVHCSAGKDRTGIVIAMVLAVLGVPDDIIGADYALSASYLDDQQTPAIGQLRADTGLGEQLTSQLMASPPRLILNVLARARASHGSVDGYLLAHGLGPADLAALRAALAG
jgi:protein-tyrosine phosphatase